MSTSKSFTTTSLSAGRHVFYFQVADSTPYTLPRTPLWSPEATDNVRVNKPPTAYIHSIGSTGIDVDGYPTLVLGEPAMFQGVGFDTDGGIHEYEWSSNVDGKLSDSDSFNITDLTIGHHTIYFKVKDNDGAWSEEVATKIIVRRTPVVFIGGYDAPSSDLPKISYRPEILDPKGTEGKSNLNIEPRTGSLIRWTQVLSDQIRKLKQDTGTKKVDIVGYSAGGLIARWYIEKGYRNDVRKWFCRKKYLVSHYDSMSATIQTDISYQMINFKGRHFEQEMILQSVRWYLAYSLSYRDIEEMMKERGFEVDHSTIQRWVVHYSPKLEEAFHKKKRQPGNRWRLDETYIKVKGQWKYLYRAVDKSGNTIDFLLTAKRDMKAALRFLTKAIGRNGKPGLINIDKSGANTAAIKQYNQDNNKRIKIRQCKYLNNIVEQDHRRVKRITRPMMGFKSFNAAQNTLTGIEVMAMIKKGQMKTTKGDDRSPAELFYALAA